jgi:ABC-2 type transport system ATP-binding protein
VIILDEPFANLDPTSVNRLKKVLKGLKIRTSPSWFQAMFTTHVEVCDRIVALNKGNCKRYSDLWGTLQELEMFSRFKLPYFKETYFLPVIILKAFKSLMIKR